MNIAFDKDGTMTDLKYIPIGKGTGKEKKTILDTAPDLTYQNNRVIRKILCKAMTLYTRVCPYRKGMSKLSKELIESGDKLFVITSTCMGTSPYIEGEKIRKEVELSLLENDIAYNVIIYTKSDKVQECIENKIDIIIEDSAEKIKALRAAGITTIRFIDKRNKHITGDEGFAAKDMDEVALIIKRIKKEYMIKEQLKNIHNKNLNNVRCPKLELKFKTNIV